MSLMSSTLILKITIIGERDPDNHYRKDVQSIISQRIEYTGCADLLAQMQSAVINSSGRHQHLRGSSLEFHYIDSAGERVQLNTVQDCKPFITAAQRSAVPPRIICTIAPPMATGIQHPGAVCNGCESDIYGTRFKCSQCPFYDLCERCWSADRHPQHIFYALKRPEQEVSSRFERRIGKWLQKSLRRYLRHAQLEDTLAGQRAEVAAEMRAARETGRIERKMGEWLERNMREMAEGGAEAAANGDCQPFEVRATNGRGQPMASGINRLDRIADVSERKQMSAGFEMLHKIAALLNPVGVNLSGALRVVGADPPRAGGGGSSGGGDASEPDEVQRLLAEAFGDVM